MLKGVPYERLRTQSLSMRQRFPTTRQRSIVVSNTLCLCGHIALRNKTE